LALSALESVKFIDGAVDLKTLEENLFEKVKNSPGVYFTNHLLADFCTKNVLGSFYRLTVWLCNFLAKEYCQKSYL